MRGKRLDRAVIDRARELYTQKGFSPEEIIEELSRQLLNGQLVVEGKEDGNVELPQDRSAINRWAKLYEWSPKWKEAKKQRNQAIARGEPFAITNINDPIFHLSRMMAFEITQPMMRDKPKVSDELIQFNVIAEVAGKLDPGPEACRRLKPIVMAEIQRVRKWDEALRHSSYGWIEGGGYVDTEGGGIRFSPRTREEAMAEGLIPESEKESN